MSSHERDAEVPAGFEPLFRTSPFLDALGPFYCRRDDGGVSIGLRIVPKHGNARGLAHGGVLLTLCDIALGYSAAYSQDPPLTLTTAHMSADFAGSARIGDWVESRADIQRIGGRLAFVNVYFVVGSTRSCEPVASMCAVTVPEAGPSRESPGCVESNRTVSNDMS